MTEKVKTEKNNINRHKIFDNGNIRKKWQKKLRQDEMTQIIKKSMAILLLKNITHRK